MARIVKFKWCLVFSIIDHQQTSLSSQSEQNLALIRWAIKKMDGKHDKNYSRLSMYLICCVIGIFLQCIIYVLVYPESEYVTSIVNAGKGIIRRTFAPNGQMQTEIKDENIYGSTKLTNSMLVQTIKPIYHLTTESEYNSSSVVNNTDSVHQPILDDIISIPDERNIVMGCAIKWVRRKGLSWTKFTNTHPLFKYFLPSFCATATHGYHYHFYLSHDYDDELLSHKEGKEVMLQRFQDVVKEKCNKNINVSINIISVDYHGKPAWAQNDAMMAAYMDNMPYYYRVNDDTTFKTKDWTLSFIKAIKQYKPSKVGVVGPTHRGGNVAILTYDFVHQTHMDIFGLYYPRAFPDWYADDWITKVYKESNHMKKMTAIQVVHMLSGGRYKWHSEKRKLLKGELESGQRILTRYLKSLAAESPVTSKIKIISFNLASNDAGKLLGAVRNAQLIKIYYPGWIMRVYIEDPHCNKYPKVDRKYINKLRLLGCEIVYINSDVVNVTPMLWKYFVADDKTVSRYLVRLTDTRPTDRELLMVQEWEQSDKRYHIIRDHPSHTDLPVVDGLFGGIGLASNPINQAPFGTWSASMTVNSTETPMSHMRFLRERLAPVISKDSLCHDSISCRLTIGCVGTPPRKILSQFVGQKYNAYHVPMSSDNVPTTSTCLT